MSVVNKTHVALLGGENQDSKELKNFYLYNIVTDKWTVMPDIPSGRANHACEVIGVLCNIVLVK